MGCQLASEEAHEQRQYITYVQYACYTIPDVVRLFISAVRSSHLTWGPGPRQTAIFADSQILQ